MSDDNDAKEASFLRAGVLVQGNLLFPEEPPFFSAHHVEKLFAWAADQGTSDITIQTNENIVLEIYGKNFRVTKRRLTNTEVLNIIVEMYKSESAKGILSGDKDLDFPFQIRPSRGKVYRFRVNVTSLYTNGQRGAQITARVISALPHDLKTLNLEEEVFLNMAPKQGMVVITGATGSGKTTLLSSIIRYLLEQPEANHKILTYESPIEYVYEDVEKPSSTVAQTEVPGHLPTFSAATRNSLRRKPTIILVGEARDAETLGEAVTASMTGHLLYTTVHSNGFADTIRRMVNVFPENEKNARAVDILSSLRLVVSQRLVNSTDGKRVALREYVIFNEDIVDEILSGGLDNLTITCRGVLRKYGRSFVQDAREKFKDGRISAKVLKEIELGARGDLEDNKMEVQKAMRRAEEAKKAFGSQEESFSSQPILPGMVSSEDLARRIEDQETAENKEKKRPILYLGDFGSDEPALKKDKED